MTPAEFYTVQFYLWEYRGRGWYLADDPVYLEPPFVPYYRHGYSKTAIDDGKRHTVISKFIETLQGNQETQPQEKREFGYETFEPFYYDISATLQALRITVPKERKVTPEKMKALLTMLVYSDAPVSFELIGTATDIIIQFVIHEQYTSIVETYMHAFFPGYALLNSSIYLDGIFRNNLALTVVDFGLQQEFIRPLHTPKSFSLDPLIGVISMFEQLKENEHAGIQIIFQPTVNQWNDSILRSVTMHDGTSFFINGLDAPEIARNKISSPLYAVTIRAFAQAAELTTAFDLLQQLSFAVQQGTKSTYNALIPLSDETYTFDTQVQDIVLRESHRLGMLLNLDELIALVHMPSESIVSKKVQAPTRKTKEVPPTAKNKECVIGINTHNGIQTPVTVGYTERLKHTHIVGATGTGKSTLISNLIMQDIEKGIGVVLFDPHGDLVDDVVSRISRTRIHDVVFVDPSDLEYPIGLNILEAHSDTEKEVLASDLVAIFRKYATSWGDQMNTIVANAILAILESKQGGSLHDLRRFLIEKAYRQAFLATVTDPAVIYYWQKEYPLLKSNSIGPILTRINTFLRPKAIRNMVVQKNGLDFETLLNTNKIILLKLSQGLIGIENSFLLGSLILSKLHQAILRRQQDVNRNPVFIYLDEFHHFITPSIKEMIGGIRKYNVGLTLSHQDLQQLQREDGELLNSVLGNCTTRIVFRVGEPDAKKLQDGLSGFDYVDLQNLGRGEAIIRIEQPKYDCSLDTIASIPVDIEQSESIMKDVIAYSRTQYATPRSIIEENLFESYDIPLKETKQKEPAVEEQAPKPQSRATESSIEDKESIAAESIPPDKKNVSTHRYLQTLVKKMAESKGFTATVEMMLPDGSGNVDVLLAKDGKTIAVEICHTTDAAWESHNIMKCMNAGYTSIVSVSGDAKQLEKIRKTCHVSIPELEKYPVYFFKPDALFSFLDAQHTEPLIEEVNMKGYRINVSYTGTPGDDLNQKRESVAKVILNTLRKHKS